MSYPIVSWRQQLQQWALDGAIRRASKYSLGLAEYKPKLLDFESGLAKGDFSILPRIELCSSSSMNGAAGAFAASTGTIYLNQDWLNTATEKQILAVLTEELGHFLDDQLKPTDTPGDEGEVFSKYLNQSLNLRKEERIRKSDDQISITIDGEVIAAEASTKNFNFTRNWELNEAVNINFNELIGLNPNGYRLEEKGNIINLKDDGKIGTNWVFAEYDAAARLFYDYGFTLDLGNFDANLNGGAGISIDGTYDNSGLNDIILDFNVEPITLKWSLQSPEFAAWAYLGYETKLYLNAGYDIETWWGKRYSDEFTLIDFYAAGKIGGQTGFGSGEIYNDTAVVDGFNSEFEFGNADLAETNYTSAPQSIAWTEKFGKYLNFNLYDIGIPKPKLDGSSIEISSDFKIFELNGDLDQAIADWTGIPISGDYRFGWNGFSVGTQWSAVDITPTFALNGYYDISLDLTIPDIVNIYNTETTSARSMPLATISFDDYENDIEELLEKIPKIDDANKNGYLDLELEIKPNASLSGGLGLNPQIFVDWSAISAQVSIDVLGYRGELKLGPIFPETRETIWNEDFDIVRESGLDLGDIIPTINVPISIPAQIYDEIELSTELFPELNRFDLSSNVQNVRLRDVDAEDLPFAKPIEVTLDAEFYNGITLSTNTVGTAYRSNTRELAVILPDQVNTTINRNFIFETDNYFSEEKFVTYSIIENENADIKKIKLDNVQPSNNDSFGSFIDLEAVAYNDSEGSDTKITNNAYGSTSSILSMKDGNDSFYGPLQGSVISMGPGNDSIGGWTSNIDDAFSTSLQTEREALFKSFHPSLTNSNQTSKKNISFIDMGDGSDSVVLNNYIENSNHTDLTVNLDKNHADIISVAYNNGGNTHAVRIAGDEDSRGKTDVVEVAWNGNESGTATNLKALTVNHPIGSELPENASRTAVVAFAGIKVEDGKVSDDVSYVGGPQQVILDYSQMAPDPRGENFEGVKLEINGADGYQTPDINGLQINVGLEDTIGYFSPGYLDKYGGDTNSNGSIAINGSNLNDVFIVNEHISKISGNSGYDTYILNSAYAPLSVFSVDNGDNFYTQSFIADHSGHSVVKIKNDALSSFYNFGELTYTALNTLKLFSELNVYDVDLISSDTPTYNMETWALDLSSIDDFNTEKMYRDSNLDNIISKPGFSDRASEVMLGGGRNIFDADAIWADPIQDRIDESSYMFYQLSNGFDTIYSRSKVDVFFVTEGEKILLDDSSSDDDAVVINASLDAIKLIGDNRIEWIDSETETMEGAVELENIETISIRYSKDDSQLLHIPVEDLFADDYLLLNGIPESYFVDGIENQILNTFASVLTDRPNSSEEFGYNMDGSFTFGKNYLTSRLQSLRNTEIKIEFMPQAGITVEKNKENYTVRGLNDFNDYDSSEPLKLDFKYHIGERTLDSSFNIVFYDPSDEFKEVSIADQNGIFTNAEDDQTLKATIGNGGSITSGTTIAFNDADGDGEVTGDEVTLDINQDGIEDVLPSTDIIQSELIQFDIELSTDQLKTIVDLKFDNPIDANNYKKYYSKNGVEGWHDFIYDPNKPQEGGAELFYKNGLVNKIKLHLIDGGAGDADGVVNGIIEDPGVLTKARVNPYDGIIKSVQGKGKLRGTEFADAFTFESFDVFTKKSADKVIGFDASQGDSIAVSPNAFPELQGASKISFVSTKKGKELRLLSKQDYDFVYFEKKGRLYFDGNGTDKYWGANNEGGLVAILKRKPELSVQDFTLLA